MGQRGQTDIAGLDCIHITHSDNTESRYYIKTQEFPFIINLFRKYFRYFVPLLFAVLSIRFILPFLSEGPLYLAAMKFNLLLPCEANWLLTISLFQNIFNWNTRYDPATCFPFVTD